MKNHQLKLFYINNKTAILKAILLVAILLFCLFNLSAQEESNIKLKIEAGLLWTSGRDNSALFNHSRGLFLNVEPMLKTSKKSTIGLRIGFSVNEQKFEHNDPLQLYLYNNPDDGLPQFINPENGLISFVPTFDYYFNEGKFRPYLGIGAGYYFLFNYTHFSPKATPSKVLKTSVDNQIGFLLRAGLEFRKLIIGFEFNYIPKTDIEIPTAQRIGTVVNRFIGLSFGYSIGIGES